MSDILRAWIIRSVGEPQGYVLAAQTPGDPNAIDDVLQGGPCPARVQPRPRVLYPFRGFDNPGKPKGPTFVTSTIDGWRHCAVGHTFAIPSLNLFVPVSSPDASASLCSSSPCVSGPYSLEKFSFMTPPHSGEFRWQCFVPCGGGFEFGNGGPMQTIGYMMGQMNVVGS